MVRSAESLSFHGLSSSEAIAALETTEHGLTAAEAAGRLAQAGPNRLPQAPPPSPLSVFIRQFQSPLIYILAAAGVVSLAIGEVVDASFIFGILFINAAVGGLQEWRAERSSHALRNLIRTKATVLRDGEPRDVDAEQVVVGDVIWLESGNRVPADIRLIHTQGLEIDESLLTGESLPASKDAGWLGRLETPLADRSNMAHAGSIVSRGRGKGLVVATSGDTSVGRLALDVSTTHAGRAPLMIRLERFTRVIGLFVLFAAVLLGVVGVLRGGHSVAEMFLFAVALAVSAIPEGLPVALTVALAVATTRMARRHVIVRKLAAVEGLGSCTLIASDKTGTLTCNELTVRQAVLRDGGRFEVEGEGYAPIGQVMGGGELVDPVRRTSLDPLARVSVLCSEAHLHQRDREWAWSGDPTDVALLCFAHKLGWTREGALDRYPQQNQIPFEPERQYAATFHEMEGGSLVCVKGAPERVLAMCAVSDDLEHDRLKDLAHGMAARGQRVLGLAEAWYATPVDCTQTPGEPHGLELAGFVGMIDPLRPGVRGAIDACRRAGVEITMITGDHPLTALAIGRDLSLARDPEEVVTGAHVTQASEQELGELVQRARVFARMAPHQKLEVVEAARRVGHFVAVTGDGVNDAPALKAANIGVAMGRSGTDVARDASDLVLADDNLATIVAGIEEGRIAYGNIRKVIYLLVSTGAAEVVLVALSLFFGLPLPLLPVQLLWLNLVTNGIQDVTLAFEPGEGHELERAPRSSRERVFNQLMIERTLVGALVIGVVGFLAFRWMLDAGWSEASARNALLLLMVLFENVHIGNSRSETTSIFTLSPLRSPILLTGAIVAFVSHVSVMHIPQLAVILGAEPVSASVWFALIGLALTVAVGMELHKWTWRLRNRNGSNRSR